MAKDNPLIHPGDHKLDRNIRRRSDEETERERQASKDVTELPGGAEGGDESPSADLPMGLPAKDNTPLGDTDQHSSGERLPPQRREANQRRDEG